MNIDREHINTTYYIAALNFYRHVLILEEYTFNQAFTVKQETDPEIKDS